MTEIDVLETVEGEQLLYKASANSTSNYRSDKRRLEAVTRHDMAFIARGNTPWQITIQNMTPDDAAKFQVGRNVRVRIEILKTDDELRKEVSALRAP